MAVLGLRFCVRAFSSCGERGPLFIAVRGPLIIAASLVVGHRLQTRRLSSCGARAQLLRGTWDPPRPGLEPVSPALAGRFSTTAPPGKPQLFLFIFIWFLTHKKICKNSTGTSVYPYMDSPTIYICPICFIILSFIFILSLSLSLYIYMCVCVCVCVWYVCICIHTNMNIISFSEPLWWRHVPLNP